MADERRPMGRPPIIDRVVRTRPGEDGDTDLTVAQVVVEAIAAGNYIETAAAMAGVNKHTLYAWLKRGAAALANAALGKEVADGELPYADFSTAVERAQAEAEVRDVTRLAQLAAGGLVVRTVTRKVDKDGNTLEETTKEETLAPNAQVIEWRLERRFRHWGRTDRHEHTGPDGQPIPLEVRAQSLLEAVRHFQDGDDGAEPEPEAGDEDTGLVAGGGHS